MTHKERVLAAINHREPDRVPIDLWATPEVSKKVLDYMEKNHLKEIPRDLPEEWIYPVVMGHDFIRVDYGPVTSFYMCDDPEYYDEWGVKWRWVDNRAGGRYTEIVEHPLRDIEDVNEFELPDFKDPTRYEKARLAIEKLGNEYAIMGGLSCTLFELGWYLRGMQQVMIDMLINKDFLHAYLEKLMVWAIDAGKILTEMGVDIIFLGDDFGSQNTMIISPELFREFFKERYARMISEYRKINPNVKIAFHCDGYFYPIIKDLIEVGVDILNPIQPKSMDPVMLKKEFGRELSFWGAVENQEIVPFGTADDVVRETKAVLESLSVDGGLIIGPSHAVQSNTPVENIMAFYNTVWEYKGR